MQVIFLDSWGIIQFDVDTEELCSTLYIRKGSARLWGLLLCCQPSPAGALWLDLQAAFMQALWTYMRSKDNRDSLIAKLHCALDR